MTAVREPRWRFAAGWGAIMAAALALRISPLFAAHPYTNYVDEGNLLRPVAGILREGGWDPRWYKYPELPIDAIAAVMRLGAPISRAARGASLRDRLSNGQDVYDVVEPFALVLAGRLLSLIAGLAAVVLTGVLAGRLAGRRAGLLAALYAAVVPALALRSGIASVDAWATVFTASALVLTERSRASARPGLIAAAAGAAAGLAAASKYPAGLAIAAFFATTLLLDLPRSEKARRCALAAAGFVVAFAAAMPASIAHPDEVAAAIRKQGALYDTIASPNLWSQAVGRAEWTLSFDGPEIGWALLALAAAGTVVASRDRRSDPVVWGWIVLAAASIALYGSRTFQPFRNLMPLVPLACASAAMLLAGLRGVGRVRFPPGASIAVALALAVSLGVPLALHARRRFALADSRTEAVDWLAAHTHAEDRVLVVRELGVLGQELRRLPARVTVRWWDELRPALPGMDERFVVVGVLERPDGDPIDIASLPAVASRYVVRRSVGEMRTAPIDWWWRGNRQIVRVLERRR